MRIEKGLLTVRLQRARSGEIGTSMAAGEFATRNRGVGKDGTFLNDQLAQYLRRSEGHLCHFAR
jgi:hypothetical protein